MKNPFTQLNRLFALAFAFTIVSCSNDDNAPSPVTPNNEITAQDFTVTVDENPTNGQSVGTVQAESEATLNFSITSQAPSGALEISSTTGELTITDATLFDFELNPIITADISVTNTSNTETVTATVNLNNVNELSVQDFSATIDENPTDGQVVGTMQANGSGSSSFSIASQTPAGALSIDTNTGELSVFDPNLFDYESNSVIVATISVDNSGDTNTATATINLNDLDEVSIQQVTLDIDENPANGAIVGTVQASSNASVSYTISFQNPAGAFNIDANTGELTVADESLFDFETNPNMVATITVENGLSTASANALVNLNDINEIGEYKYGGVIFWMNAAGNAGLVCDIDNIANPNGAGGITWNVGTNVTTGASGTAVGNGQANTTAIINNHGTGNVYAASLCVNLTAGGYSDWYLPSLFELHEIGNNLAIISATAQANGGAAFTGMYHWSSTEMTMDTARVVSTNGGNLVDFSQVKNNSGALVRAVRSWTDL